MAMSAFEGERKQKDTSDASGSVAQPKSRSSSSVATAVSASPVKASSCMTKKVAMSSAVRLR